MPNSNRKRNKEKRRPSHSCSKTLEPSSALADLDTWLISITCARDEMLELSIKHLEMAKTLFPETGDADPQASRAASTVSRSTRYSSLHSRASSMTSSQRKRELEIAKLRRLEIERQNETGIRLKEKENELALETLVEENKRKLNEAKIVETELMDDDSDNDTDINKTALPSSRTQQVVAETRTKDWVDETLDTHSSELALTITIVPRQEPQPPGIANLVSSSLPPSTVDLINVHLFPSSSNPSVCLPLQSVVSSTVHNLKVPSQPLPPPPPPPSPPSSPPLPFIPRMPAAMVPTLHASVPINTTVNTATQPVNLIPITAPPASIKSSTRVSTNQPSFNHPHAVRYIPNMNTWRMAPPTTAPFTASDSTVPQALNAVQTVTPKVQPPLSQYPCTVGGTVFYNNQAQVSTQQLSEVPSYPHSALAYPTSFVPQPHNFASTSVQPPPNAVTLEDLKEIQTFNRKDPLPPWNLRKYGGCPLQWFEWIGQFRSAVDSQNLSDDVKMFAANSQAKIDANIQYSPCLVCKGKHSIFKSSVFKEKTPTQRAKFCAEKKLCFSCFQGNHMFRKCPKPKTCPKPQCKSTHNVLLHGAERVFPTNNQSGYAPHTTAANPAVQTPFRPTTQNNTCGTSLMNLKGLMPLINLILSSNDSEITALVLCHTACSHSCTSPELARRLNLTGRKIDLTVNGANCSEDITSEQVYLNVSSEFDPDILLTVCAYVKNNIYIGSDIINVRCLQEKYSHLEPIDSVEFRYADVEVILGQVVYEYICPLEYCQNKSQKPPWLLSWQYPGSTITSVR